MGSGNVASVMLNWRHLPSPELRLLIHMALLSVDPPGAQGMAPCLYWGSVESQAMALNYTGKHASRKLRERRANLVEAGAIELVRSSARGRSPTWRLVPDPGYQDQEARPFPWLGGPQRA